MGGKEELEKMEAFMANNDDDCYIEVTLADPAVVCLWNGTRDQHLCSADIRHMCPSPESLEKRFQELMPLARHSAFICKLAVTVDDKEIAEDALDPVFFAELATRAAKG